jgi:hypothetical protein
VISKCCHQEGVGCRKWLIREALKKQPLSLAGCQPSKWEKMALSPNSLIPFPFNSAKIIADK